MASVGVGAATVDTKLERSTYRAGEQISGVIEIRGGNTAQQIDAIYLTVTTTYTKEANDSKYETTAILKKIKVNEAFTVRENEAHTIPFSFVLPPETPVTMGKTKVWIQTGLDIKNAVDPTDKDFIDVQPSALAKNIIQAVEHLGFYLRKVDCESAPMRFRQAQPFLQEFEFTPTSGTYRQRLDELEVTFLQQSENQVELLLQVDRRARGLGGLLSEALDMDESHVRLTIYAQDNIVAKIQQTIDRHL